MPTGLEDLIGQLSSLQMKPFVNSKTVGKLLLPPVFKSFEVAHDTEQPLLSVLAHCMHRQTKEGSDFRSIQLPPLLVEDVHLPPSEVERASYDELFAAVREQIDRFERSGTFGCHILEIQGLLLKLRMACDHRSMAASAVQRMREASKVVQQAARDSQVRVVDEHRLLSDASKTPALSKWLTELLAPYHQGIPVACPICLDACEAPTLTSCQYP